MNRERISDAGHPRVALALALCLVLALACSPEADWEYRPADTPIGWAGEDLIFFRSQAWGVYDVFTTSCEGTGVFRLSPAGGVSPVRLDEAVCDLEQPHQLSPDGTAILATRFDVDDTPFYSIALVDLGSDSVWVTRPDSGFRWIGDPVWMGPEGNWAYLAQSPDAGELRIVSGQDSSSRPLFQIETNLRIEGWDTAGQVFRLRLQSRDSTPSILFDVDTLGSIVSERPVTDTEFPSPSGERVATVEVRNTHGRWRSISDFALIVRDPGQGAETEVFASDPDAGTVDTGFGHVREGSPGRFVLWERDGNGLVFPRFYRNGTTLWRIGIDGSGLRQLTQHDLTDEPEMPSW